MYNTSIKRKFKKKTDFLVLLTFSKLQVRFEKVDFPSLRTSFDFTGRFHIKIHSLVPFPYIVVIHANYHAIVAATCHAFFSCVQTRVAGDQPPWMRDQRREERREEEEKAQRAVCTRVIRKRQPPRAAWALSSKNKQNVARRVTDWRAFTSPELLTLLDILSHSFFFSSCHSLPPSSSLLILCLSLQKNSG